MTPIDLPPFSTPYEFVEKDSKLLVTREKSLIKSPYVHTRKKSLNLSPHVEGVLPGIFPGAGLFGSSTLKVAPTIEASANSSANNTTNFSVTMPAGIVAGELLLAQVGVFRAAGAQAFSASGWSTGLNSGAGTLGFANFYKTAAGSDTLNITSGTAQAYMCCVTRISGWTAAEFTTYSSGTSTSADPPSISPSWGAEDTLYVPHVASYNTTSSPPSMTNYTLIKGWSSNFGIINGNLFAYQRDNSTSTEDPPAITITNGTWRAATVAVRGQ